MDILLKAYWFTFLQNNEDVLHNHLAIKRLTWNNKWITSSTQLGPGKWGYKWKECFFVWLIWFGFSKVFLWQMDIQMHLKQATGHAPALLMTKVIWLLLSPQTAIHPVPAILLLEGLVKKDGCAYVRQMVCLKWLLETITPAVFLHAIAVLELGLKSSVRRSGSLAKFS